MALLDESKDVMARSMLADIEAATTLDERLAALWRTFWRPPAEARDWLRLDHEVWVWATRPGNDRVRARLDQRYRTEFATLAEALDAWATEGLLDLPASADGVATVMVSTRLVGDVVAARPRCGGRQRRGWRRCGPWSEPWP